MTPTTETTLSTSTVAPLAARKNFARSLEALAAAKAPGFESYLASLQASTATSTQPAASTDAIASPTASIPTSLSSSSTPEAESSVASPTPSAPETEEDTEETDDIEEEETDDEESYEDTVSFGLDDFVDLINPLQHIPVISALYRHFTDDEIQPSVRVVGDMAYGLLSGSPIITGLLSIVSSAIEQSTNSDPQEEVVAALFGDKAEEANDTPTQYAEANPMASSAALQTASASSTSGSSASSPPTLTLAQATSSETPLSSSNIATTSTLTASTMPKAIAAYASAATTGTQTTTSTSTQTTAASFSSFSAKRAATSQLAAQQPKQTASTATAASVIDKAPYGGVMDTSAIAHQQASAKTGTQSSPVLRIGDKVFTSPTLNRSAKMVAARAAAQKQQATLAGAPQTTGSDVLTAGAKGLTLPEQTSTDGKTLGSLLQSNATTVNAGGKLPDNMVRDMMLMGLDKYKTAQGLSPSEFEAPTTALIR